jgi:hypothetical protein
MSVFIKEASDYFAVLSAAHEDVKNSAGNKAFCRFQDNEQFNQLRLAAAKNIVVIMSFFGKSAGGFDDATVKPTIVIRFSCYSKSITSADITTALEKAMAILLDFWIRMRRDYELDSCLWLKNVDWENIQFDEIEQPWLQNHYGWDLVVPYLTELPEFDQSKWNDIGEE